MFQISNRSAGAVARTSAFQASKAAMAASRSR
jgi:hypothetical protein